MNEPRESPVDVGTAELKKRLVDNKKGGGTGVYSVCSAHKTVLEAAMTQGLEDDSILIIEATSNQVDQFGGYTGMTPPRFKRYVEKIAAAMNFPVERIILGGDHLGPNSWQAERAETAMEKACGLVRAYAGAGFRKLHLDASMFCADDPGDRAKALPDEISAARAARLCAAAEDACRESRVKPLYVIGTEVPIPGGAKEKSGPPRPTTRANVEATLEITKKAFIDAGLAESWERVIGIVAQPGVEFGDDEVFYYDGGAARELSAALDGENLVFEAHSTDYQPESCLRRLVEDHFCILKVGPALTFAYREAMFALSLIERELIPSDDDRARLEEVLEDVMLSSKPNYWEKYYHGDEYEQRFKRRYSFSDRSRYYWANQRVSATVEKLFCNLSAIDIPLSIVSQYFPRQFTEIGEGRMARDPRSLVLSRVKEVIAMYSRACKFSTVNLVIDGSLP
ncbi:MAG: class II D-tagatose-bisphosphate aldolase, non-catalytic subunit [Spirochaetaceae bacterium]|jgi:D-tagatose-1,6-bisphosphate aldolase subunit GatZ/KbaZ|nr:class II D-tagatose-bisphosphate aldolase, non-catalytic subunit [Spirochaetaceae bacterium]